jgi:hypothetical protein
MGRPRIHPKPTTLRASVNYLVPWDRDGNLLRNTKGLPRDQVVWRMNAQFKATLRPVSIHWTEYETSGNQHDWYEFRDYYDHVYPMFRDQVDELRATGHGDRPSVYGIWDVAKAASDGVLFFGVRLVAIL